MRLLLLLVAAPLTFAASGEAAAQPVTPQAACSYSDCAIRIEPAFFLGPEIVQGEPGNEIVVGRVGALMGGLEEVVASSPGALEHAGSARRARLGSLVSIVAGAAVSTYVFARAIDNDFSNSASVNAAYYGGIGLVIVGGVLELKAQREQSRAVWEYNRTVAGE